MTREHQDRIMRIVLLTSSAQTIGGLLNWWRTGHLSAAMIVMMLSGAVAVSMAVLHLSWRSRAR